MKFDQQRKALIERLEQMGFIANKSIKQAMLKVRRELFVAPEHLESAYVDSPLPIPGGATISAPHMHAMFLSCVKLRKGKKFLEVGFGSGILLAYAYEVVGKHGKVVGVEVVPETYEFGIQNLKRAGYAEAVETHLADGSQGWPDCAPYDAIVVSAASPKIFESWLGQLKPRGRLAVPLESFGRQELIVVEKLKKKFKQTNCGPVSFIPLILKSGAARI